MIREVNIFKAGTQTSAQGITREFTKGDLSQIAQSYDPGVHEAPIRIGHEDNDKVPAWGWVKGVKLKGDELYAEIDFSPLAEDYIKNGLYKKVSASFYSPESKINPEPGKWSLRHVALLGAQPPAVKGLKGFAYEEHAEGVMDFASDLAPEAVFDDELGPTLKRDINPLEILKEKLDEARAQMNTEESAMEQELEAPEQVKEETQAAGEFAEGMMMKKPKKAQGSKMGEEGDEDEEDEDSVMSKEMEGKNLPEALKKNAAKKKAAKEGISEEEAMEEGCGSKKGGMYEEGCGSKKKMNYEESDSEEHGEATAEHDGKVKGLKAPAPKGMSGMEPETVDGEGPVASKVKKDAKSGACDPECEDDEKKFEEPTFEPAKKKRGSDGLNTSDTGVKETEGGPGGLVRTKSTSKGVNLGYAEDELDEDDEQHAEDTDPYTKRGAVGKAGVEGETDRGMTGKAPDTKGYPNGEGKNSAKGTHAEIKGFDSEIAKDGGQDSDRKKKGKAGEIKGFPDKYQTLSNGGGSGKQVKSGKVRVMAVNHSEADPLAAMMARLEELEAANAKLREQAEFAERQANRMRLEQFAEGLYESGRLTDAVVSHEELVDYMEGLEYGTLEFAEGESAATPLMRILENLPCQVCFEEVAGGESFVNEEELDPHQKALKLSKEEGIEYAEALKQVLFTAE